MNKQSLKPYHLFILLALSLFPFALSGNNTPASTVDYCSSTSDFPWEDWIAEIEISNLSNPSGKTAYSDFTNKEVTLNSGTSYDLKLTTGFSYFTSDEYWQVWIDYNGDGSFDGASENVFSGKLDAPLDGTPTATLLGTIAIPPGAPEFSTRMRVSMTRGGYAEPCDVLSFGEVEDYTVNITNSNALPDLRIISSEFIPGEGLCFTDPGKPYAHFGVTIQNSGDAPAGPYKVKVYWSKDLEISANDVLWKELQFSGLDVMYVGGFDIDDPVPASLDPGIYYVIVQLDADNEVAESNENNNKLVSKQNIGAPDFILDEISGIPTIIAPGDLFNVDHVLKNISAFQLNELPGAVFTTLHLSSEPVFNSSTAIEIGVSALLYNQFSNPPLHLDGTNSDALSAVIPNGTLDGDYFLFLQIENTCEKSRLNNLSEAIPIQVTNGTLGTYCTSTSDYPWEEWISGVELANLSNSSGKSTYSDFTNQTAELSAGEFYTIRLTTSYSYFTSDEYWRVWVDLNQDGDFNDAGEMVVERTTLAPPDGTPSKSIQDGLNIPAGSMTGTTRMRVAMKREAYPTPCETLPHGEVEDYTINITDDGFLANLASPSFEFIPGGNSLCYTDIGEPFANFGVTIVNYGVVAANPFKVKITWSKDDQMSADDLVWKEYEYDALPASNAVSFNISDPVPTSLEPGNYYAFVEIDSDHEVTEPNELDNIIRSRQTLGAPDFIIDEVTGIPASIVAGDNLDVAINLRNISPFPLLENVGTLPLSLYLSEDADLNFSQDQEIGTVDISFDEFSNPPFYDNGTAIANLLTTIPSNIAEGGYFLFARIKFICEKSAFNNLSNGIPIQIANNNPGNYCDSKSDFPWHEWIAGVSLENLDNSSSKSNYSDFTNQSVNLEVSGSYAIELTSGFSYFTADEYWSVWMDLNQNNIFETSELRHSQKVDAPADGIGTFTTIGYFSIPFNAMTGSTRMRVAMKRGGFASPCETLPFGEVEDYTVIIGNNSPNNRAARFTFEVEQQLNEIQLSGIYQSQEEVDRIEVEKSIDGLAFELLEKRSGTASADGLEWINSSDKNPQEGLNFYRVLVKLKSGKEVYSSIKSLEYRSLSDFSISPNPAKSQITIALEDPIEQEVLWTIKNTYGQTIWSNEGNAINSTSFQIDIGHLVPGIYYLIGMRPGRKMWSKKFVVVN